MEKDIDRISKNPDTDIVIRVDDYGGRRGLTIREFIRGDRYTGFTKAGTRVPAEKFKAFKDAINSIDEKEMLEEAEGNETATSGQGNSSGHTAAQGAAVPEAGKPSSGKKGVKKEGNDSSRQGLSGKSSGGEIEEKAM